MDGRKWHFSEVPCVAFGCCLRFQIGPSDETVYRDDDEFAP